ncbi:formin-binding protein 1 isoform X6 [Denticeps clupeoides]|uniref:formin-binding protein 1 isoform X6 n=1 Tax=Denticeps clupeoides TaxID=299321 RepID=UPI0010A4FEBB|nr:formin-binding protein 1-like isoform X6 [Denticeps clupeoides]
MCLIRTLAHTHTHTHTQRRFCVCDRAADGKQRGDMVVERMGACGSQNKDQFDNLEKHTQWGIDFVEKYSKFVKERSEIEVNYARQIRNLSRKFQPKKSSKEEEENKYSSCRAFLLTLNELNDYAGQHEVVAENLTAQIIAELTKYTQELKSERKSHFQDGRKAQQHIENSWKQLESCKRRFERDCKEAERAQQYFEKLDADINVTKLDVEKARQQAQMRQQMASESKEEYSNYLQKFNQEQNQHYYTTIPNIFQRIQDMEEKRIERLAECMRRFADEDRKILPIVGHCLDGMTKAAESIEAKADSKQVVEQFKSGFEPPSDVEFEDYGQTMKRTVSETSLSNSRGESKPEKPGRSKGKLWPFIKKNKSPRQSKEPLTHRLNDLMSSKSKMHCFRSLKRGQERRDYPRSSRGSPRSLYYNKELMKRTLGRPTYAFEARQYILSLKLLTLNSHMRNLLEGSGPEDFSHLPPEQRRKKLQAKIDELNKEIHKEMDQRDALTKMKDVYIKNPQMGDPASLDPRLGEIAQNIDRLQTEAQKFEGWLAEVEGRMPIKNDTLKRQSVTYDTQNSNSTVTNNCTPQDRESSPDGSYTEEPSSEPTVKEEDPEFNDDEFDEGLPTIGTCKALYPFEGTNEGTISLVEGELLFVIEEDKGDGWTRVRRNEEEEGYVPTTYVEVVLDNVKESCVSSSRW